MTLKQKFIHYVSANMISMIGLSLYILADTFFIAKGMGANGLTALNLALPVYNLISGIGMLIAIGGAAQFIAYKSTENKDANNVFLHGLLLVGVFGTVFVFIGLAFSNELATILGANQAIHHMTSTYLKFIMIFAPAFMLNNVLSAYTKNDGDPHLAMIGMLAGSLFNIIFDYIFIFPLHLGMLGAVLATAFSPIIGILILSTRFFHHKASIHLGHLVFKKNLFIKTFTLGFPSLINEVSGGIVMLVFNYLILHIAGNTGVAAYGVIVNIYLVILAFFNGIAQGVQPLMGECFAKDDLEDLEKVRYHAIVLGLVIALIVYILMFFFKSPVVIAFNSEQNKTLQNLAESGLILYFIAPFFASYNIITIMYLISINQPYRAQIITLLRGIIILIPAAFLLSATMKMTGIWLTLPLTELFTALVAIKFQHQPKRSVH